MAFTHGACGGQHDTVAEARQCQAGIGAVRGDFNPFEDNPVTIVQEATPESDDAYERMSGPIADEGFYKVGETYFKVQQAKHGSGRRYAKELVDMPVRDEETGELISKGYWDMARGVVYKLRKTDLLSVEEAAAFGQLYGICMYCWSELTDERSIEVGYGPVCADKRGLPWG